MQKPPRSLKPYLLLGWLVVSACSGASNAQAPPDYHHDIAPLITHYCLGCHTPGGIAPLALGDYASVRSYAGAIQVAVQDGLMPPWMPSEAGVPLQHSRKLRTADRELLLQWITNGTPEGDAATPPRNDFPAVETEPLPRADMVVAPAQSYQPDSTRNDDYHCFVFDPQLSADKFLVGANVVPGNRTIVHHVLMFEVLAADAEGIRQKNIAGGGYTCFGGPGSPGRPTTLFGWVPGSVPMRAPEGTAIRLHQGSLLVMQVHYNMLASKGAADRTVANLELSATPPRSELYVVPVAAPQKLKIAAGDANAKQIVALPVSLIEAAFQLPIGDLLVYGNAPHMHLLGRRIVTAIADQVLVEIPHWDFHWQQSYMFTAPVAVRSGDTIQVECDYDNSQSNQPVVDGVQQTPRDVTWGEGTLDEMCLSFLSVTTRP